MGVIKTKKKYEKYGLARLPPYGSSEGAVDGSARLYGVTSTRKHMITIQIHART